MDVKGKHVLVLGLGLSGKAVIPFLLTLGAKVYGADKNIHFLLSDPKICSFQQKGVLFLSDSQLPSCIDIVIVSPGIPPSHSLLQSAKQRGLLVLGELELGVLFSSHSMMGLTGTNGKTTVTLMTSHILKEAGYPSIALGNVGVPITQELLTIPEASCIVLELSSYQLETLAHPSLNAAAILNITPDHLDRYPSMEAYAKAKMGIENCLKPGKSLYIEEKAFKEYGHYLKTKEPLLFGYHHRSFIFTDLKVVYRAGHPQFDLPSQLQGKRSHHIENLLASYALCAEAGIGAEQFMEGWRSFKIPNHRIQWVANLQQVDYYDDSKGTNIDATMRAVQSFDKKIILIAGGVHKGFSYLPWLKVFKDKVKSICVIGEAADKIEEELGSYFSISKQSNLEEAVFHASKLASPGEVVLLSPGCSSFDMFKDYVHRGQEFQRIVKNLVGGEE